MANCVGIWQIIAAIIHNAEQWLFPKFGIISMFLGIITHQAFAQVDIHYFFGQAGDRSKGVWVKDQNRDNSIILWRYISHIAIAEASQSRQVG
jgi:hypothetical protein